MSSSSKLMWGLVLGVGGTLIFGLGAILTATGIGACLGIPLILVAIPLCIWGGIWIWQGKVKRAEEAIAAGVQRGIEQAAKSQKSQPPLLPPQNEK